MAKRIYFVSATLAFLGLLGFGLDVGVFNYFAYSEKVGAIKITGHSDDSFCDATEWDHENICYAYINFTALQDTFWYPLDYDPYGRNISFEFEPQVKDWEFQRRWGKGWREIPMNRRCTGTWCGGLSGVGARYSVAWREGRDYEVRVAAIKNSPQDTIKWNFGFDVAENPADPIWFGRHLMKASRSTFVGQATNWRFIVVQQDELSADITFEDGMFTLVPRSVNLTKTENPTYRWKLDIVFTDQGSEVRQNIQKGKMKTDLSKGISFVVPEHIINFQIILGENSTIIDVTGSTDALDHNPNDNIVKDSSGNYHVGYEGPDNDLWHANSSHGGLTWSTNEIEATSVTHVGMLLAPNSSLIMHYKSISGNIEFYQSNDEGATWIDKGNILDHTSSVGEGTCDIDSNNVIHCCAIYNSGVFYENSSTTTTETVNTNVLDDTDDCEIVVGDDDYPYVFGMGTDEDDLDVWSPNLDGWGDANRVQIHDFGTYLQNSGQASAVTCNDTIAVAFLDGTTGHFCNSSTNHPRNWSCQSTYGSGQGYYPQIAADADCNFYVMGSSGTSTTSSTNDLYFHNSSDGSRGGNWKTGELIHEDGYVLGHMISSRATNMNILQHDLGYVYQNYTGQVLFNNRTIPHFSPPAPEDSCSCPASGDWVISDVCTLTTACDMQGNNVTIQSDGNLTVQSGGNLTDFDYLIAHGYFACEPNVQCFQ